MLLGDSTILFVLRIFTHHYCLLANLTAVSLQYSWRPNNIHVYVTQYLHASNCLSKKPTIVVSWAATVNVTQWGYYRCLLNQPTDFYTFWNKEGQPMSSCHLQSKRHPERFQYMFINPIRRFKLFKMPFKCPAPKRWVRNHADDNLLSRRLWQAGYYTDLKPDSQFTVGSTWKWLAQAWLHRVGLGNQAINRLLSKPEFVSTNFCLEKPTLWCL